MRVKLTAKENEVINHLCAGLSNKHISERMNLSVSTIKTHLRRMFGKMQVSSRLEAVSVFKNLNPKKNKK